MEDMILGIGTDIIEISRIEAAIKKFGSRFLDRIFSEEEQEYCKRYKGASHYAGRFAAKEAAAKALGTGFSQGINWLDIQIINDAAGKPCIALSSQLRDRFDSPNLHVSISHCHSYATAFVIYTHRE
jgi:holo-[acyl-carrier protein] synthase